MLASIILFVGYEFEVYVSVMSGLWRFNGGRACGYSLHTTTVSHANVRLHGAMCLWRKDFKSLTIPSQMRKDAKDYCAFRQVDVSLLGSKSSFGEYITSSATWLCWKRNKESQARRRNFYFVSFCSIFTVFAT